MASEQLWFLQDRGKELGPFSPKQLKQLAESGRITPEHNVRMGNDGDWIAATKVNGLFRAQPKPTDSPYPQRAPESTRINPNQPESTRINPNQPEFPRHLRKQSGRVRHGSSTSSGSQSLPVLLRNDRVISRQMSSLQ